MSHHRLATVVAAAAALVLTLCAPPARAGLLLQPDGDACELTRYPLLTPYDQARTDSAGYTIGMGPVSGGYATLWDGGLGPAIADTWNGWGQLFVGASPASATAYASGDARGCSRSVSGRQIDFATVGIGALQVRRSMYVPSTTLRGVRIADAITNTSGGTVTTGVWVGDLFDGSGPGLGSDGATTIRSTSSGDAALSVADRWAVTTDDRIAGGDPAIAHLWGDADAPLPVSTVRSGAQLGDRPIDNPSGTLGTKQLGWGWEQVTLAPGETARFVSWAIPHEEASHSWVDQAPLAQQAAEALLAAPLEARYQGMTPEQIASVRNWAPPAVAGTIAPVVGATTASSTTLQAVGVDFGSSQLPACDDGELRWDFGDGSQASGATVTHRFAAGPATVTLNIEGECGGTLTRSATFSVSTPPAATPAPADPTPVPTLLPPVPAEDRDAPGRQTTAPEQTGPSLKLYGPPSVKTTTLASSHGLVVGVRASVDGEVRLVLTGTGVKSVKSAMLKANQTAFVKVQLDPSARPVALTLKSIRLRAKLVPRGGGELVENLFLKLRR